MSETEIISQFYKAFKNLDAEAMVAYYHDDVEFEDPAFGKLYGIHAKNMWRMLCKSQQGKDFKVKFNDIQQVDYTVTANWEASYTFSITGRKVHNKIKAKFLFKDSKIIKHNDHFRCIAGQFRRWVLKVLHLVGCLFLNQNFKHKPIDYLKNLKLICNNFLFQYLTFNY
jgi:ketosteroid isomerase-like protein